MSACSLRGRAIRSWHKGQHQDFGAVLASGWAIQAPLCGLTLLASTLAHRSTFCGLLLVSTILGQAEGAVRDVRGEGQREGRAAWASRLICGGRCGCITVLELASSQTLPQADGELFPKVYSDVQLRQVRR